MAHPHDIARRTIGVHFSNGKADVRVWAPNAKKVDLQLRHAVVSLKNQPYGYWHVNTDELTPGDKYRFVLDGDNELPDPASLSQPDGVHGPSQAIDLSFDWTDATWNNPPLDEYIFYELHVGTFSPEGTFDGVIKKIPYLKKLGITAIEIMPVAHFPGERNWGYDGVFPFAVHTGYGGPKKLQQLVNACHGEGIAVVLDVVYNHVGPEGNYFSQFGPFFTPKYKTPWGDAINFDDAGCDGVRHFFIENALMWFRDFHIDALRLDAVHAIKDLSPEHFLKSLRIEADVLISQQWRKHYLIVELDLNDTRFINSQEDKGYGMDGQWIDEFHHALRVTAGQKPEGYYADFNGTDHLMKAYRDAYVYDGQFSEHRGKYFGTSAAGQPGNKFVVFSQNHDQTGNRMLGERTSTLVAFGMLKVLAGATLLSPYLPLLFMGEEYGEVNPFLYFVHHSDKELIENVRKGRKAEFAPFHHTEEAPDPQAEETFLKSKLQWDRLEEKQHQALFRFYQELIRLRKEHPALKGLDRECFEVTGDVGTSTLTLHRWTEQHHIWCLMNFSHADQEFILPDNHKLHVLLNSEHARFLGLGASAFTPSGKITLTSSSLVLYSTQHD